MDYLFHLFHALLIGAILAAGPIAAFYVAEWIHGRRRARREIRQAIEELI
jgi:hypothetical protein